MFRVMISSLQGDRSPLHLAAENGLTDMIYLLLTHGANVDSKDWVRN